MKQNERDEISLMQKLKQNKGIKLKIFKTSAKETRKMMKDYMRKKN